jgi:hypothetical protein
VIPSATAIRHIRLLSRPQSEKSGREGDSDFLRQTTLSPHHQPPTLLRKQANRQKEQKMQGDRTIYVPTHVGPNIFPCHSLFNRLIRFAHHSPPRLCVRDGN